MQWLKIITYTTLFIILNSLSTFCLSLNYFVIIELLKKQKLNLKNVVYYHTIYYKKKLK